MLAFKNLGPCTIYIPCTELSEYPHLHTYVSITELSPTVALQLAFFVAAYNTVSGTSSTSCTHQSLLPSCRHASTSED